MLLDPTVASTLYDPYLAWKMMDNYLAHFLHEQSDLDLQTKDRLNHFRYQYLTKVSNIFPENAALFAQNISSWSSPYKNDYHRFHHLNPLLSSVENALASVIATQESDVFVLSNRKNFEAYLAFLRKHHSAAEELFSCCHFGCIKGLDVLLVPRTEKKSDQIREWIVEKGFTPTLQQTAQMAAHLSLYQENLAYQFPNQNPPELCLSSLLENSIFKKFKALGETNFSASVVVGLIEGFNRLDIDERFKRKGLSILLEQSYGRVLGFLEQSLCLDLSKYLNLAKLESLLDLVHEEILLWLMIAEPYSSADLVISMKKTIPCPSLLKTVSTGMAAFSEVLKIVLEPEQVILLYDGCYFENRASLLKSSPVDSFYIVRSPDYWTSLEQNLQKLKEQKKTVDLLFINFHENILKGRYINRENHVADVIAAIEECNCISTSLTVVIDHTIGYLNSTEIQELLDRFRDKINSRALHIVVLWSHQKFDLLGFDKLSGGSYAVYSRDESLLCRFQSLGYDSIDFVSKQGLAHYFATVPSKLEERRDRIFSNARYVNEKIAGELKFNGDKDRPFLVVVKEDIQNFSVDVQCSENFDSFVSDAFIKQGIPLMIRSGFGYNLTTISFTKFNMLRFSIGIEDQRFLDEFIAAFNAIFSDRSTKFLK